jgi:hypothetical protein
MRVRVRPTNPSDRISCALSKPDKDGSVYIKYDDLEFAQAAGFQVFYEPEPEQKPEKASSPEEEAALEQSQSNPAPRIAVKRNGG